MDGGALGTRRGCLEEGFGRRGGVIGVREQAGRLLYVKNGP